MPPNPAPPIPAIDMDAIRNVSERIYRDDLGPRDVAAMIAGDGDAGEGLRRRAGCMDRSVIKVMKALDILPRVTITEPLRSGLFDD